MSIFGLREAEVASLVRPVAGESLERDAIEAAFARAAWSGIAEPGDGDAGLLVAALGPAGALAALIAREPAGLLAARAGLDPDRIAAALDRWAPRLDAHNTLTALRQAARFGAALRTPELDGWPEQLNDLGPHAPLALWTRGPDEALAALADSVALVGARAATAYGEHVTGELSAGLSDRGLTVVSGAAYGIDGMAHRAALASEAVTVAFLAGGVDRVYPSGHEQLLTRIAERGLLVSEPPCGSAPTRWRFLQRNRLIAAASRATVVVEAGFRSGSLNTANHAAQLGRPVGVVPGPVTSPASAGCHRLLRGGPATCITSADEVLELIGHHGQSHPSPGSTGSAATSSAATGSAVAARSARHYDPNVDRVLDALSPRTDRTVPELAARSGLSERDVTAALGRLHLADAASRTPAGWRRPARSAAPDSLRP